jgi:hypothetical protein
MTLAALIMGFGILPTVWLIAFWITAKRINELSVTVCRLKKDGAYLENRIEQIESELTHLWQATLPSRANSLPRVSDDPVN